jgi:glycosyltransferase involved in cell wall biosynthesis
MQNSSALTTMTNARQQPLISVIMPCHNSSATVAASIQSVLQQTVHNFELVIVDDGSTDNSLDVISGFDDSRIHLIKQQNMGVCAARNTALDKATGVYIAFLDSDDSWAPDCLDKLHHALRKDNEAALAYCGWQNVGITGPGGDPFFPPDYERQDKPALLLKSCRWPIHATLTRREIIKTYGPFDSRFRTAEDFYLWLKIGISSKIVLVPEVLAYYHHHTGHQASNDKSQVALDHWLAQKAYIKENPGISLHISKNDIRLYTDGELLKKGFGCYWKRQLEPARKIFRQVMKTGYGSMKDWMYMIPCLLPLGIHRLLLDTCDNKTARPGN